MKAIINNNGNSRANILHSYIKVSDAFAVLYQSLNNFADDACHGRNYQLNADPEGDRKKDIDEIREMIRKVLDVDDQFRISASEMLDNDTTRKVS